MREINRFGLLTMAVHVTDEKSKDRGDNSLEEVTSSGHLLPCLAALLACREATPKIMEHEKAVLVMKEHNYAKAPELTQLAPFLQQLICPTDQTQSDPPIDSENIRSLGRKQKNCSKLELLGISETLVKTRQNTMLGEETSVSPYLRSMVTLQASLIHELQDQLHTREIETNTVRREKEQLEARLERMERRLNILQKRSRDKDEQVEESITSETPNTSSRPQRAKLDSITRLTRSDSVTSSTGRSSRSRSSSVEPITGRRPSRLLTGNPTNSLEVSHRAVKRGLDESDHTPLSKRSRSSVAGKKQEDAYVRTNTEYDGLNLHLPLEINQVDDKKLSLKIDEIKTPSWRESNLSLTLPRLSTINEDTSDDTFSKRHSRPEADEKRRKRWDAQRIREQLQHEQLLKRYMQKESGGQIQDKKKEKLTTFQPKLEEVEILEIADKIVVSAFGRPLPKLPSSSFQLGDFNPHTTSKSSKGRNRSRLFVSNSVDDTNPSHVN